MKDYDFEAHVRKMAEEEERRIVIVPFSFDKTQTMLHISPPDVSLHIDGFLIDSSEPFMIQDLQVGAYSYTIQEHGLPSDHFALNPKGRFESKHRVSFDWSVAHKGRILAYAEKPCTGKIAFMGRQEPYLNAQKRFQVSVIGVAYSADIGSCVQVKDAYGSEIIIPIPLDDMNKWLRKVGKQVPIRIDIGDDPK